MPKATQQDTPPRRTFLGHLIGAAAGTSIVYGCTDLSAAASDVAAAYKAYQPYDDTMVTSLMTDAECDAWSLRHKDAVQALADARATTAVEIAKKLDAAFSLMDDQRAWGHLCEWEGDLLRSCLRDLRAMAEVRA